VVVFAQRFHPAHGRLGAMSSSRARPIDELRLIGVGGTNKVMAGELSRLARRALRDFRLQEPRKAGTGALVYPFDARLARVATLYHRTSARVLWDVMESSAERLEPLFDDVLALASEGAQRYLWDGARISVYAHGVEAFAAGERQIIGTVKNGLIEGAARQGLSVVLDPEAADVVVAVRGDGAVLRISLDLAGRPMNQRGYRKAGGTAPLREDLAAVLLMLARYDPRRDVLIDPMAGSGTIAIEAACMAKALPVWVAPRTPLLVRMPTFRDVEPAGDVGLFADAEPLVIANDILKESSTATQLAAEVAGVGDCLRLTTSDFRDLSPRDLRSADRETGLILSNPPYGERLDVDDLGELYADLARFCAGFPGYRAAFLVANPDFETAFGRRARIKKPLSNGPLRGYFYLYDL
jgi:23S rRNA G2445 N2-methylase RlmL